MALVTKKDWIDALTKAKKQALRMYPDQWCIVSACRRNGIAWGWHGDGNNAEFNSYSYTGSSAYWMADKKRSRDEVAAVFDRSIEAIKKG